MSEEKNIYDQFREAVISDIHGLPYEEYLFCTKCNRRIKQVKPWCHNDAPCFENHKSKIINRKTKDISKITIGRVLQAMHVKDKNKVPENKLLPGYYNGWITVSSIIEKEHSYMLHTKWKLTKENGQECTHLDQEEETIKSLLKLLK